MARLEAETMHICGWQNPCAVYSVRAECERMLNAVTAHRALKQGMNVRFRFCHYSFKLWKWVQNESRQRPCGLKNSALKPLC